MKTALMVIRTGRRIKRQEEQAIEKALYEKPQGSHIRNIWTHRSHQGVMILRRISFANLIEDFLRHQFGSKVSISHHHGMDDPGLPFFPR